MLTFSRVISFLRGSIPPSLKRRLKRQLGLPETRLHSDWAILAVIGPLTNQHVILDVGAHHGWFFHCWQDWCPAAEVHAFEPHPKSFEIAHQLFGKDARVRLNKAGVGSSLGELTFNVFSDSDVSSSFLTPEVQAWETLRYKTGSLSHITVPVTTLDAYVREHHLGRIYLVKIDVQGYEMHVLRGAEQSLSNIDHIFVEVGIERLYEGAPRFTEVFEFLTARGFHLMTMRAWHRGNHVLMETDMLFRRNELAPPVDESVVKVMEQVA